MLHRLLLIRCFALTIVLLLALWLGISLGPTGFDLWGSIPALFNPDAASHALISAVRLPRTLIAAAVGATLALAGAAMQAVFRNPLAEPGITGVSSGAAVVAVLCITSGIAALSPWILPAGAFCGALLTVMLVQTHWCTR